MQSIPPALLASAAVLLAANNTHTGLGILFAEEGLGELPLGNKVDRALAGLKRVAKMTDRNPMEVFGQLISEAMEYEPDPYGLDQQYGPSPLDTARKRLENTLVKYGLEYQLGGKILENDSSRTEGKEAKTSIKLEPVSVGTTLRVFISYSTANKQLAGYVKTELEKIGLDVFLAHEDLLPSEEWQNAIEANLRSTDIFVPIFTEDFKTSSWADQECGIAFAMNKLILPIKVDVTPYGFLGRYQALVFDPADPQGLHVAKIVTALAGNKRVASGLIDSVLRYLESSRTWDEAGDRALQLVDLTDLVTPSDAQFDQLERIMRERYEVGHSFRAVRQFDRLYSKFGRPRLPAQAAA
jgi:hypothetical protein